MDDLTITRKPRELVAGWRWRQRSGEWIDPRQMATSHLFYVLRMIWNNFLPKDVRVGDVKLYRFGATYTEAYMKQAIYQMAWELGQRDNLARHMVAQLDEMAAHLDRKPELLK